ncbi:hypothetical protein Tco_1052082, partial [Tanacetum coccineum]
HLCLLPNKVVSEPVDLKFDDEMQDLLLLSLLPDSWSGTVTVVSSTSGTNKLTFEGHIKSQCKAVKGAVNVSMDAFDDALLCCIEKFYESWVMNSGASSYATPCVGMMKNFKSLLGKVRLADRKVLDVTGIGDVGTLYMVEILVTKWSGENLIEDVYREAERKNAINERLCRKLGVRLRNWLRVKLYNRLRG